MAPILPAGRGGATRARLTMFVLLIICIQAELPAAREGDRVKQANMAARED
jgi:hypothetical protein